MKPIKELIPEEAINYNQLRIILAIFEYEYGYNDQENNEKANQEKFGIENIDTSHCFFCLTIIEVLYNCKTLVLGS